MRVMTSAMAQAWIEYLIRQLNMATAMDQLAPILQHAHDEMETLTQYDLIDSDEALAGYEALKEAHALAESRLQFLDRVHKFTGEPNPVECNHTHQRYGTGVFFNSVQALKCLECGNWQEIRRVIL